MTPTFFPATRPDPPELLALNASQTGAVELHGVLVPRELLIAGPVEGVMKQGTGRACAQPVLRSTIAERPLPHCSCGNALLLIQGQM